MDEIKTGTEANAPTIPPEDDLSLKLASLEAEKVKLTEEKDNYRRAYLKVEREHKSEDNENETADERMRRIAQEELANSRIAEITREVNDINIRALKENKELKLALLNKGGTPPAAMGTHSETTAVADTLITQEQIADFKKRGWDDKTIERYKKNLLRNTR